MIGHERSKDSNRARTVRHASVVSSGESQMVQSELIPAPPDLQSSTSRGDHWWINGRVDEALAAYEEGLEHCADIQLLHKRIAGLLEARRSRRRIPLLRPRAGRRPEISIETTRSFAGDSARRGGHAAVLPRIPRAPRTATASGRRQPTPGCNTEVSSKIQRCILANRNAVTAGQRGNRAGSRYSSAPLRVRSLVPRGRPDELLYYPGVETRRLDSVRELDRNARSRCPPSSLNVFGSPGPPGGVRLGQDPVQVSPFFDREFFPLRGTAGPSQNFEGFAGGLGGEPSANTATPF